MKLLVITALIAFQACQTISTTCMTDSCIADRNASEWAEMSLSDKYMACDPTDDYTGFSGSKQCNEIVSTH